MAMRSMACVAQGTVNQLNIVLVGGQDGYGDAVAPVQIQIPGKVGLSRDIRMRSKESSQNSRRSPDRGLKTVTSIMFPVVLAELRPENGASAGKRLGYDSASPLAGGQ